MQLRPAALADAETLAALNHQLIRDEGHRNAMTLPELAERMRCWLSADYQAVVAVEEPSQERQTVGYALFKPETDYLYIRQLFVTAGERRKGIGRSLVHWVWERRLKPTDRMRIDVLVGNTAGQQFWRSLGFEEYCLTMETSREPN